MSNQIALTDQATLVIQYVSLAAGQVGLVTATLRTDYDHLLFAMRDLEGIIDKDTHRRPGLARNAWLEIGGEKYSLVEAYEQAFGTPAVRKSSGEIFLPLL